MEDYFPLEMGDFRVYVNLTEDLFAASSAELPLFAQTHHPLLFGDFSFSQAPSGWALGDPQP